ncbi:MAG: integrase core domain-containing protein [Janthinobacterium lividum]
MDDALVSRPGFDGDVRPTPPSSTVDSYDKAMTEAFNSLLEAECIRNPHSPVRAGPWRGVDDVEIAVAEYINWYTHRRLHGELGMVPPVEHEARFSTTPALKGG